MLVKMKPAFFELSEAEQKKFTQKDLEKMEALGYKLHYLIDCSWSNQEWQVIGVEEWPSLEAIKAIEKFHDEELRASKYVEMKTFLGTPIFDKYAQTGTNR
jgi:hypothetical protein